MTAAAVMRFLDAAAAADPVTVNGVASPFARTSV